MAYDSGYGFGASVWIGAGKESAYNTPVARTNWWEPTSDNLEPDIKAAFSKTIRSLAKQRRFITQQRGNGGFETELFYQNFLKLFEQILWGSQTTAVNGTYVRRHEFARTDTAGAYAAQPAGLTLEANKGIEGYLFSGMAVGQAVIKQQPDGYPTVNLSMTGGQVVITNTGTNTIYNQSTPTFAADALVVSPSHLTVKIGTVDWTAQVKDVEITIGNQLDGERGRVGSIYPKQPVRSGRPDALFKLGLDYESVQTKQMVADYLANTQRALTLTWQGALIGTETANYYKLMIEAPVCNITAGFPKESDVGVTELPVELTPLEAAASAFANNNGMKGDVKVTAISAEQAI